ncbi:MAG TPA: winged helix-turn-helix domain-containing protein, partial [Thermoanaerobaculia bacterium]|nr:winged helix-turn-helix domain-containing protein [Thermoanaerobaculia bacterium]
PDVGRVAPGRLGGRVGRSGRAGFRYTLWVSSQPVTRPPAADFRLADRVVRPARNRIEGPAGSVQVEPKVMEVLACLARQPGAVVGKEELVREVWEGRFVSDDVVWRSIRELRRALGDDARTASFIETIPKRGYRLLPPVAAPLPAPAIPAPLATPATPGLPHRQRPRWAGPTLVAVLVLLAALAVAVIHRSPRHAQDPRSRDAELRGRYHFAKGTPPEIQQAITAYGEAIALDPAAAEPRADLADAYHLLAVMGRLPPAEAYPPAEAAVLAALSRDPGSVAAHTVLGSVRFRYRWDYAGAERELKAALAADPGYAPAHHDYAWLLLALGRPAEALREIRRAQALQPLSLRAMADVGWVLYRIGRTAEAITSMRRLLDLEPGFTAARQCLERALAHAGRDAESLAVTRDALLREGASPAEAAALTAGGGSAGAHRRVAAWRLARLVSRPGYVSPYAVAALKAEAGDTGGAFATLEQAFAHHDPAITLLAVDPEFVPLRTDPRFQDLLRQLGLPAPP